MKPQSRIFSIISKTVLGILTMISASSCGNLISAGTNSQTSSNNQHPSGATGVPTAVGTSVLTIHEKSSVPDSNWGYGELLPGNYDDEDSWPVLINFHGLGDCIGGPTLTQLVDLYGPIKEARDRSWNLPMLIFEPQSACDWNSSNIDTFVQYIYSHYKADPKRLYISGISLGGGGVSFYLDDHADKVAAAVPIAANAQYRSSTTPNKIFQQGIAVWAAVASDDDVVGEGTTQDMIVKVWQAMGLDGSLPNQVFPSWPGVDSTGYFTTNNKRWSWINGQTYKKDGEAINPPYILTIYQSGGHAVWDRMFSDHDVYDWLLSYHR